MVGLVIFSCMNTMNSRWGGEIYTSAYILQMCDSSCWRAVKDKLDSIGARPDLRFTLSAASLSSEESQAWTRMNAARSHPALLFPLCSIEGVWTSNDEPVLQWKGFQTILTAVIICDVPHIKHKSSCLKHRLYELRRAGTVNRGRLGLIRRWNMSLQPQLYLTSERN